MPGLLHTALCLARLVCISLIGAVPAAFLSGANQLTGLVRDLAAMMRSEQEEAEEQEEDDDDEAAVQVRCVLSVSGVSLFLTDPVCRSRRRD